MQNLTRFRNPPLASVACWASFDTVKEMILHRRGDAEGGGVVRGGHRGGRREENWGDQVVRPAESLGVEGSGETQVSPTCPNG